MAMNNSNSMSTVNEENLIRRSLEILLQQDIYTTHLDRTLNYKVSQDLRNEYEEMNIQLQNFSKNTDFKQELTNLQLFATRYRFFITKICNEFLTTNASINRLSVDQLMFLQQVTIMGGKLQSYNQLLATAANSQGIYMRLREAAILNEIDNKDALEYLRNTKNSDNTNNLTRKDIKEIVKTNKSFDTLVGVDDIITNIKATIQNINIGLVDTFQFIIFYGIPGTGKTAISESLATEFSDGEYYKFDQAFFASAYVGVTESRIRSIFEKVRSNPDKNFTIVIDEADNVLSTTLTQPHLNSIKILLQTEISSHNSFGTNLIIICITNYLSKIDQTFKRRATNIIEVKEPTPTDCINFLESQLTPKNVKFNDRIFNIRYLTEYKNKLYNFDNLYIYTNSDMGRLAKNVQDNFLLNKIQKTIDNYFVVIELYFNPYIFLIYSKNDTSSKPYGMPQVDPNFVIGKDTNITYIDAMNLLHNELSKQKIKLSHFQKYFAPDINIMSLAVKNSSTLTIEQAQIYKEK